MRPIALLAAIFVSLALPAASQTIDRIKETGEIKLGYRTDAAPMSFANNDGLAAGYSPFLCAAVANAISERLGIEDLKATFVPVDTESRFEKVASGEIDLLCGAATITLSRREIVDFSIPTYVDGAVVMLPRNAGTSFKDLAGKRIGVRTGTTTETALDNSLAQAGIEAEKVKFDSHDEGVDALRANKIDAYFGDQSVLVYQSATKNLGSEVRLTSQLLTIEKQGLAMARGDSEFRLLVDTILSGMFQNGSMRRLYTRMLPGVQPGAAMKALHLISPTLP